MTMSDVIETMDEMVISLVIGKTIDQVERVASRSGWWSLMCQMLSRCWLRYQPLTRSPNGRRNGASQDASGAWWRRRPRGRGGRRRQRRCRTAYQRCGSNCSARSTKPRPGRRNPGGRCCAPYASELSTMGYP